MRLLPVLVLLALAASPAAAETRRCLATVNGSEVSIDYDPALTEPVSRRERLLGWPGRTWDRAWGAPPACDSALTILYLAQSLPGEEIDGYCLARDGETDSFLLVPGERGFRGRCTKTTCERVNDVREDAVTASAKVARTVADVATGRTDSRIGAVAHSSGAAILSGNAGPVSAALSGIGPTVVAVLTAPATLAAAAVSVVTIGGVVYVCHN